MRCINYHLILKKNPNKNAKKINETSRVNHVNFK